MQRRIRSFSWSEWVGITIRMFVIHLGVDLVIQSYPRSLGPTDVPRKEGRYSQTAGMS